MALRKIPATLFLLPFLLFQLPSSAKNYKPVPGKVVGVTDGDTLKVRIQNEEGRFLQVTVRLHGIDSPERRQDFGAEAKEYASSLAFQKVITLKPYEKDRLGRVVADVILPDGRNLNHEMVKAGMAWWYEEYAKDDPDLPRFQEEARKSKLGLWSHTEPVSPWRFRGEARNAEDKPPDKTSNPYDIRNLLPKYEEPKIQPNPYLRSAYSSSPSTGLSQTVYVTNHGKNYHAAGCLYLSSSQISILLSKAKREGYRACSKCGPGFSNSRNRPPSDRDGDSYFCNLSPI